MIAENDPLVSFCLMSCNQRDYIEEAFRAALNQDYSNLEIIVSDDGSKDGTWEIVQRMASAYEGPHKIILNRNEPNLGTIGNWQKLCQLSHGELLVKVDGDDISYPQRARVIANDWVSSGREAVMMASSYDIINMTGDVIGEKILPNGWDKRSTDGIAGGGDDYFYLGAVMACHRSLFDDFPLIEFDKSSDCAVYEARGLMSRRVMKEGNVFHPFRTISEKLIQYRVGSGDTTGGKYRNFVTKGANRVLHARCQALKDLELAKSYLPASYVTELRSIYERQIEHQKMVIDLYTGTFRRRWAAYRVLRKWDKVLSKYQLILLLFLLPRALGDWCFAHSRR